MIAALPWVQLAATLAQNGLPTLAKRIKSEPAKVIREAATALTVAPTADAVETAIASDPEAIAKLAEVDLAAFEAAEGSRQAARDAWRGTWMMGFTAFFGFCVLAIFAWSHYRLTSGAIPAENLDQFVSSQRLLEYVLIAVVGFLFGSSVGSKLKGPMEK